jgi:alkanesulfonate monooxygenase SsuD/methylene tetrahydromethanopterin reductase-like flavin-dependent oxidoreductase (luciferase family)
MVFFGLKRSQHGTTLAELRQVWAIADEGGFDGCWVYDHFAPLGPDPDADLFEGWTLLAALAEATRRVRIGCMVTGNTYRHPAVLAKMAVTVDHLSGGRLDMGLGAGAGREHTMLGIPDHRPVARFAEAIQILKLLWTEQPATFQGEHYRLQNATTHPGPLQRPRPPLWLAAIGEKRSLRIVAEHADVWVTATPFGTDPKELRRLGEVLDRHCADLDRDPATIRRAVQLLLPDSADEAIRLVQDHVAAGITDVIIAARNRAAAESAAALLPRLQAIAG